MRDPTAQSASTAVTVAAAAFTNGTDGTAHLVRIAPSTEATHPALAWSGCPPSTPGPPATGCTPPRTTPA